MPDPKVTKHTGSLNVKDIGVVTVRVGYTSNRIKPYDDPFGIDSIEIEGKKVSPSENAHLVALVTDHDNTRWVPPLPEPPEKRRMS
ncbi:hypothetical protein [Shimazuella alba]|uniref:Uncharacterized protein n=1 Tax=Shimazuella alba TaxID=2690964 RepID=A0A6I4VQY8_9BACL|nr:hypothetical protein [Shimazuella alba]MXQ52821.1 hypothetical protein [Shimazuella alba]